MHKMKFMAEVLGPLGAFRDQQETAVTTYENQQDSTHLTHQTSLAKKTKILICNTGN